MANLVATATADKHLSFQGKENSLDFSQWFIIFEDICLNSKTNFNYVGIKSRKEKIVFSSRSGIQKYASTSFFVWNTCLKKILHDKRKLSKVD